MPDDFSSKDFDALLDEFINKQLNETDDILADFQEEDEEESAETKPSLTPDDEASFEEDNDENYDTDVSEEDSVSKEDSAPELIQCLMIFPPKILMLCLMNSLTSN